MSRGTLYLPLLSNTLVLWNRNYVTGLFIELLSRGALVLDSTDGYALLPYGWMAPATVASTAGCARPNRVHSVWEDRGVSSTIVKHEIHARRDLGELLKLLHSSNSMPKFLTPFETRQASEA